MIIHWLLGWSAERNGRRDGRNAIPLPDDPTPPPYLLYLRDAGQNRLRRLALSWKWKDKALFPAWVRRKVRYEQACGALARAEQEAAAATARRDASPTARHTTGLAKAKRAVAKARARVNRAHDALAQAAARRQARWGIYQARLSAICHETDTHMQRYITANVGAREDGRTPLGLLDANRPRPEVPESLQRLAWNDPEAPHA
ncbi:MAG: hypothetical protein K0R39_529 [Symbiobacteriaceae bacterium]|jgi:hypothetical protein|nr:hypothetical protein [Symbiobacteriaceae bacterium]